jgi:hypothetical protein
MMKNKKVTLAILLVLIFTYSFVSYAQVYPVPENSRSIVDANIFKNAIPLNENYRKQFDDCDKRNFFNGADMTLFKYRNCDGDKNNLKSLLKFTNGAIFFQSKMSLDVDGSWKACCQTPGKTDLCSTAYNFKPSVAVSCDSYKNGVFVDPDIYPYIVMPTSAPKGLPNRTEQSREFVKNTNVKMGDIGIVIYKNKIVPVFVADGGPHNKIGEGSSALFRELGETWCREFNRKGSIEKEVLFFIFPNSKINQLDSESPNERLRLIKEVAERKFNELKMP